MKRLLLMLSALVLAGVMITWAATGAHAGWTQTSVAVKTVDEVTGIEGISYERRFVPGLDFLGAGLLGAGLLAGLSLWFRRPDSNREQSQ